MAKDRLEAAADRLEILDISMRSTVYRDRGDWDDLLDCFHADAQITTSWFEGNAHEFIQDSAKMMGGHDPQDSQKHFTGNQRTATNGDRGMVEYYLILHQRRRIDGYWFDFQTWSSSVDLSERRDGEWRILRRWNIYEKDRMDPHKQGEVPASFFEEMDLAPFPDALKYHCWRNMRHSGEMPSEGLVIEGTERAARIRAESRQWLDGGPFPAP